MKVYKNKEEERLVEEEERAKEKEKRAIEAGQKNDRPPKEEVHEEESWRIIEKL